MKDYHGAKLDLKTMEVYPQTLKKGEWKNHTLKDDINKSWKLGIKFPDKHKAEILFSDLSKKLREIQDNLVKIDNDGVIHLTGKLMSQYFNLKDLFTGRGGKAVYGDKEPKKEDLEYYYNNVSNCMPNESKKKLSFKEHYLNEMPWLTVGKGHFDIKMEKPGWVDRFIKMINDNTKIVDEILQQFYEVPFYKLMLKRQFQKLINDDQQRLLEILPDKFVDDMELE